MLLEKIKSPADLKKIPIEQLPALAAEIREYLIGTVSRIGGHLSSNLGVVELTLALHYVFDTPEDTFCWDVGHQTYTHKILTGRLEQLKTIRQTNGISGFPKINESIHDAYNVGHAGTSISQALGEAIANQIKYPDKKRFVLAITGDASIVNGMSLEAMNHAGFLKTPFIVILNDNEMSISRNVGALSFTLNNLISNRFYASYRWWSMKVLYYIPLIGPPIFRQIRRFSSSLKSILTEHQFFEELGFRYIGPLDGHDVVKLVKLLQKVRDTLRSPTLLHVVTKKGKGYSFAESNPTKYHGVAPFVPGREDEPAQIHWPLSRFVGETLAVIAETNPDVVAITPAMTDGSGLTAFADKYKNRFFDTGIAEGHATALAGAFAKKGLSPYLCVYSTFLQRSYDQLIHDIALMNFPVRIVIDRAGPVGADGATHHGLYDIAFLNSIPNMRILSPSNAEELVAMLHFMASYTEHPVAVRFPRGSADASFLQSAKAKTISPWKAAVRKRGSDAVLFCEGFTVQTALRAAELLVRNGIFLEVVSLLSLKPLDQKGILKSIQNKKYIFSLENHSIQGGLGAILAAMLATHNITTRLHAFAYPDKIIDHGSQSDLEKQYGLDAASLAKSMAAFLKKK